MLQQLHHYIHTQHDARLQQTVRALSDIVDDPLISNLLMLRSLIDASTDPDVAAALMSVYQQTRAAIRAIGDLMPRIRPEILDDPLGLPALLRLIVDDIGTDAWAGRRALEIHGNSIPLAPGAIREVNRIVCDMIEFVTNQSSVEALLVSLTYPDVPGESMQLTLAWIDQRATMPDRGRKLYIDVCSQIIGGYVTWRFEPPLGCAMTLVFPASLAVGLQ